MDYDGLSKRIKLLAHPERLRILDVLRHAPECVCHLEVLLDKPQPYVSQQLGFLRRAGVIAAEKRGLNIYYHLVDAEVASWLTSILGPVGDTHPAMKIPHATISCACPECGENIDVSFELRNLSENTAG